MRSPKPRAAPPAARQLGWLATGRRALTPLGPARGDRGRRRTGKLLVEQWLESAPPRTRRMPRPTRIDWTLDGRPRAARAASVAAATGRSARLGARTPHGCSASSRRTNCCESRPDGLSILQVIPTAAPGAAACGGFDFTLARRQARDARALQYLAARLTRWRDGRALTIAESTQRGMIEFGYRARPGARTARGRLVSAPPPARVPALALERPPTAS